MSEALADELVAINSIYGEETLKSTTGKRNDEEGEFCVIHLPRHDTWLKIFFPNAYPFVAPTVLGIQFIGAQVLRRDAQLACDTFDQTLKRIFRPGDVCLFDVMEEMNAMADLEIEHQSPREPKSELDTNSTTITTMKSPSNLSPPFLSEPTWYVSDPISELKSVFVAWSSRVTAVADVLRYRQHLLHNKKKVASATHNIMAWRIRGDKNHDYCNNINNYSSSHSNHTNHDHTSKRKPCSRKVDIHTEQDYDDDGESAAGSRLLHLMQLMDVWDVMVIVSRWYGGVKLGPRRFTLINIVARDALSKIDQV